MIAEQDWQFAVDQLKTEMPRGSFDSWVRDTFLVSYDDGLFTIGIQDAYGRDWLESRVSSTVTRLLMGIMNRNVTVQFVAVSTPESSTEGDNEQEKENIESPEQNPSDVGIEAFDILGVSEENRRLLDRQLVLNGYFRRSMPGALFDDTPCGDSSTTRRHSRGYYI
jgi:chromosomal replication initiator protein